MILLREDEIRVMVLEREDSGTEGRHGAEKHLRSTGLRCIRVGQGKAVHEVPGAIVYSYATQPLGRVPRIEP